MSYAGVGKGIYKMKRKKLIVIAAIITAFILIVVIIVPFGNITQYNIIDYDIDLTLINFDSVEFDEDCAAAYDTLMNTKRFSSGRVGEGGILPDEIRAVGKLLICKNAKNYFIQLEQTATIEGKMYALCGLYYLDYDNYNSYIEKYINDSTEIFMMSGCIMYTTTVKELIKKDGAVRLTDINDSIFDWYKKNDNIELVGDFYGGITPNLVLFHTELGRYKTKTVIMEIFGFEFTLIDSKRVE